MQSLDAESKVSTSNLDLGEKIFAETLQIKFNLIKRAVAKSPKLNLECMGKKMASPLDSGNMASLG